MIQWLKKLFGADTPDFYQILKNGAQIIDVRTAEEFSNGHLRNSKNIPLQQLQAQLKKLDRKKPVITCCASGMRSASAKVILQQNGYEAYNGGSWKSLEAKLKI